MQELDFVVAIVAIVCATSIIKSWIKRKHNSADFVEKEQFNKLAQAFIQYKKEMKQRVEHLEAIVTDDEYDERVHPPANGNKPRIKNREPETEQVGSLTNDLKEKERVR
ncbi:MAG: hypothetical protein R3281_05730 [Balneolaceae bacterium]|nr:hypothetical protein [Balneolaceae bacterium]